MKNINHYKIILAEWLILNVWFRILECMSFVYIKKYSFLRGRKVALVSLLPEHNNLGDHAIAEASTRLIQEVLPNYTILELEIAEIFRYAKAVKFNMDKDAVVCLIGGGNLGSLYKYEETARRFIIRSFKRHRVIQFPQTVYFENNKHGRRQLFKSKKIYNKHPSLVLFARDRESRVILEREFSNLKILECPDIVLSLTNIEYNDVERKGIGVCFRHWNDKEVLIKEDERIEMLFWLQSRYENIKTVDTLATKSVNKYGRRAELEKVWRNFAGCEIVITDRLHGMIFCVITKTPCIVIPTKNHKIREAYNHVSHLGFIQFVETYDLVRILDKIEEMRRTGVAQSVYDPNTVINKLREILVD